MSKQTTRAIRIGRGALLALALACVLAAAPAARAARIKDITAIEGIRSNQLYGFGLVFGLAGTGGGSDFTSDVAHNMLDKMRIGRGLAGLAPENMAAVIVTADLPPFARKGSTLDVTVSVLDDSSSLRGGTLVLTPLVGADGQVYAVAQGPVAVGGFSFGGASASIAHGHPTVARIPNGGIVEREVSTTFLDDGAIILVLSNPDFATAGRIATAVNAKTNSKGAVLHAGAVRVKLARTVDANELMESINDVQMLEVTPDARAVVVINERTGTVVAGQNVGVTSVAISHGSLTVVTQETPQVVQPGPFSRGSTETVPRTQMTVAEGALPGHEGQMTVIDQGTTVGEVAKALNLLGAGPGDVIAIFQAIKEAGALHAELRIM